MQQNRSYLVFLELVLILASILMFRSVWLLLDGIAWMSHPAGLWVSLAVGLIVGTVALAAVNRAASGSKSSHLK